MTCASAIERSASAGTFRVIRTRCRLLASTLAFALTAACATDYAYEPEVPAPEARAVAAEYVIPPGEPRGEVRIVSRGIVDSPRAPGPDQGARAVALSVEVTNDSGEAWALDVPSQVLEISGRTKSQAVVTSSGAGAPSDVVTIPAGQRRTVDLFFPLPSGIREAGDLEAFRLDWRVAAGREVVARQTAFGRRLMPAAVKGW
jgi:hypothetical protein